MSDSKITIKDLKKAVFSLFENLNQSREIHFNSTTGVETLDRTVSGPINREEFNHHLQEFYEVEHHINKIQEEDLTTRVEHLKNQLQRQNRTIARLLKEISSLKGRISDLENFSGLTEFQNELNLAEPHEELTQADSTVEETSS